MTSVATRIKHCGITNLEDAHRAAEAGAWALGMIFGPGSPRACELADAQLIGAELRRTGAKVIKAMRVRSRATLQAAAAFHTDYHLLDAYVEGLRGGTGETIDPRILRGARLPAPIILSGGLTPENVGAAIAATEPFAVDAASGTELAPGIKDPDKLVAFHEAVRAASVGAPT